jgi:hypothetical protein
VSSSPSPVPGPLSRRLLLQTAAFSGVVPLTGCQGSPLSIADDGGFEHDRPDPDEALLVAAVRAEAEMAARLRTLLPRSARRVRRSLQVHEAHLDLLRDATEQLPEPDVGGGRLSLRRVSAAEEALSRRHADAAVRASSGPFARLLAGMAAAAAQQADLWRGGAA